MKAKPTAQWSLGFASLFLAIGIGSSQAATKQNSPESAYKPTSKVQRTNSAPRTNSRQVQPASMKSQRNWAKFVQMEIPRIDKVNPGPFSVWQHRLFERGETSVPEGVHTF